jgi:hypothetical protein
MKPRPIVIVAVPASGGRFIPTLNGEPLCGSTTEPLLDGCRALLERGIPPKAVAVMRHAGSDVDCLRTRVGYAATRTVMEDGVTGPRLVRWKGPQTCVDRPPIEFPAPTDARATKTAPALPAGSVNVRMARAADASA